MRLELSIQKEKRGFCYNLKHADSPTAQTERKPYSLQEIEENTKNIYSCLEIFSPFVASSGLHQLKKQSLTFYHYLFPTGIKEPLLNAHGCELLLEIPSELNKIPWEVLHNSKSFLGEHFAMGRRISLHEGYCLRKEKNEPIDVSKGVILSANPGGDLAQVQHEVQLLKDLLATKLSIEMKTNAHKADVFERLADCTILHFAGHCNYNGGREKKSGWLLEDGILTAGEIADWHGRAPSLVFANACISGSPDFAKTGEQLSSMAEAFLRAGVRHYIGTIAPVPDAMARQLVKLFYKNLLKGLTVGESLRLARCGLSKSKMQGSYTGVTSRHAYILYGHPGTRYFPERKVDRVKKVKKKEIANILKDNFKQENFLFPSLGMAEFFNKQFRNIKLYCKEQKKTISHRYLTELLIQKKKILITGSLGSGKTMLAFWIANHLIEEGLSFHGKLILPFYLKARDFFVDGSLSWKGFERKYEISLDEMGSRRFLLIIDGLDEAEPPGQERNHQLAEQLKDFIEDNKQSLFLLTARRSDAWPLNYLPLRLLFYIYELCPMKSVKIKIPEGIEKTPFNIALWKNTQNLQKIKQLTRAQLYRYYIRQVLEREAGYNKVAFSREEMFALLQGIAWQMTCSGSTSINNLAFEKEMALFDQQITLPFLTFDDLFGTYTFQHLSFQAYFAAEKLTGDQSLFEKMSLKRRQFFDVLSFAWELLPRQESMYQRKIAIGSALAYLLQDRKKAEDAEKIRMQLALYSRKHYLQTSPLYQREMSELYHAQAQGLYYEGKYLEALGHLNDAVSMLGLRKNIKEYVELSISILNLTALILLDIYDLSGSLKTVNAALSLSEKEDELYARTLGILGRIFLKSRNYERAKEAFLKKREIHHLHECEEEVARDDLDIVLLYSLALGDSLKLFSREDIVKKAYKAILFYESQKDYRNLAYALRNMALLFDAMGDDREGDWIRAGIELYKNESIVDQGPLGYLYLLNGEYQKSIETFEKDNYYLEAAVVAMRGFLTTARWDRARCKKNLFDRFFALYRHWEKTFSSLAVLIESCGRKNVYQVTLPFSNYDAFIDEIEYHFRKGEVKKIVDALVVM